MKKNSCFIEEKNFSEWQQNNNVVFKKLSKVMIGTACLFTVASVIIPYTTNTQNASASDEDVLFQVNVAESLSVAIDTPDTWASGDADTFIRNKINVSVTSNKTSGFHASMYAEDTNLVNATNDSYTLPTLSTASWTRSDTTTTNFWAYSMDTAEGNTTPSGTYLPMTGSSSPISILDSNSASSSSKDIYFGAKADISQAAGTYTGTVIINVVTGTVNANTNPSVPTNPATSNPTPDTPVYSGSGTTTGVGTSTVENTAAGTPYNGTTTYTSVTSSNGRTTTTTEVSGGDTRTSYAPAQGVRENTKNSSDTTKTVSSSKTDNTNLSTALAITAVSTAASGIVFFIAAKRRDYDEDSEE